MTTTPLGLVEHTDRERALQHWGDAAEWVAGQHLELQRIEAHTPTARHDYMIRATFDRDTEPAPGGDLMTRAKSCELATDDRCRIFRGLRTRTINGQHVTVCSACWHKHQANQPTDPPATTPRTRW